MPSCSRSDGSKQRQLACERLYSLPANLTFAFCILELVGTVSADCAKLFRSGVKFMIIVPGNFKH